MAQAAERSYVDQLGDKPLVRVVAYYVALAAVVVLLSRIWPALIDGMTAKVYGKAAVAEALESAVGGPEIP